MIGAINGLDELFHLISILGFLPDCEIILDYQFQLPMRNLLKIEISDFDELLEISKERLRAHAKIRIQTNEEFIIFTLSEDEEEMKRIAARILVECEKKGAIPDQAFPPMEITLEYSLKQKQHERKLQKMNMDFLKESLKKELNIIYARQREKSVRKEPEPLDESLSQEEEEEIQRRRRGRPPKKKYFSATEFLLGLKRTSTSGGSQEQRPRKKQKKK